jgi:hypothetical protein
MLRRAVSIAGLVTLLVVWGAGFARIMHERLAHGAGAGHATTLAGNHAGHAHHNHAHHDHGQINGRDHGTQRPCEPDRDRPAPSKPHDDCVLCVMLVGSANAALAPPSASPVATAPISSWRSVPVNPLAIDLSLPRTSRGPPQA